MKKQTAVEWIIEQIFLNRKYITYEESTAFENAKAMEKEQMTTFAKMWESKIFDGSIDSVDDYYNETYGGDK